MKFPSCSYESCSEPHTTMTRQDYERMTTDELIRRAENPSSLEEEWEAGIVLEERCPEADPEDQ